MTQRWPATPPSDDLVLIVDDDAAFREQAAAYLRIAGYASIGAATAFEALAHAKQLRPRAVLLDVVLPDLEGPQLCRLLRQTPGYEGIPIVFTTGREGVPVLRDCLAAGGNDFIRKSHLEVELVFRLESHLRARAETERLLLRNRELNSLLYFARLLNRSLSLSSVLQSMVEELSQIVGADRVSVLVWNENTGTILATAETGWHNVELQLDKYPEVREAIETRRTVYIPDVDSVEAAQRSQTYAALAGQGIQSLLVVPIQTGGSLLGTLFLRSRRPDSIAEEAVAFCQAAAEIACRAILNAHLFEHVREERDRLLADQQRPAQRTDGGDAERDRLRAVQLNVAAEALSAIGLIQGYAELLLEPSDTATLASRHVRALRAIQGRSRELEHLLRMAQQLAFPSGSGPGHAQAIAAQVVTEVGATARAGDVRIALQCTADWTVADGDRTRSFLTGLLRAVLAEAPAHSELVLTVDRARITVGFPSQVAQHFPVALWRQMAAVHGLELNLDRDDGATPHRERIVLAQLGLESLEPGT